MQVAFMHEDDEDCLFPGLDVFFFPFFAFLFFLDFLPFFAFLVFFDFFPFFDFLFFLDFFPFFAFLDFLPFFAFLFFLPFFAFLAFFLFILPDLLLDFLPDFLLFLFSFLTFLFLLFFFIFLFFFPFLPFFLSSSFLGYASLTSRSTEVSAFSSAMLFSSTCSDPLVMTIRQKEKRARMRSLFMLLLLPPLRPELISPC